jgi:hypothetical protein
VSEPPAPRKAAGIREPLFHTLKQGIELRPLRSTQSDLPANEAGVGGIVGRCAGLKPREHRIEWREVYLRYRSLPLRGTDHARRIGGKPEGVLIEERSQVGYILAALLEELVRSST